MVACYVRLFHHGPVFLILIGWWWLVSNDVPMTCPATQAGSEPNPLHLQTTSLKRVTCGFAWSRLAENSLLLIPL